MVLIDTSAWIEFLRGTNSQACEAVEGLLGDPIITTDPVVMEVLAGARDERHLRDLRGLLGRAQLVSCEPKDYLVAAALYRQCRQHGETVRRLIDCLIASVAIRADIPLLHCDQDFDVIARHCELSIYRPAAL